MCVLTLLGQVVIYSLMAIQFFSKGKYQLNHVTLELSDDNSKILFGFDYLEQIIINLVCLTNTLWLPILQIRNWEMNHMVNVLTEHDKFQLLLNGASQIVEKVKQLELLYEESIAIRDIKLAKEIRSRKILNI